jgi:hypothetical protein
MYCGKLCKWHQRQRLHYRQWRKQRVWLWHHEWGIEVL